MTNFLFRVSEKEKKKVAFLSKKIVTRVQHNQVAFFGLRVGPVSATAATPPIGQDDRSLEATDSKYQKKKRDIPREEILDLRYG